ncbi:hypothetical protein Zm00014a_023629 [Zea mays]|uniref:Uncharacterized protein n=1 Tax=Zea mays TaxID=4577 RepID=A0A3L6DJY8_MAIZE|nr:hypothetical protein Zm00014a_023629 [Zea mays]
MPQSMPPNNP